MEPDKEKNNRPKEEEQKPQEKPQPPRESDSDIENVIELDEPSQDIKKKGK